MVSSRFGTALRDARIARGLRQRDLIELLGSEFARSTLANIEAGRSAPSERFWEAIKSAVPDLAADLAAYYADARTQAARRGSRTRIAAGSDEDGAELLGGPYVMEQVRYVYTFRESRSPEEVIETRRVRATRDGATGFGLKFTNTVSDGFRADAEPLWGGGIVSEKRMLSAHRTVYVRRFDFNRRLRRGDIHEFALRMWVERDPSPGTEISFELTIPADMVTIQLNFFGRLKPKTVARYGPLVDDLADDPARQGQPVDRIGPSVYSVDFPRPVLGHSYGVLWTW